MSTVTGLNHQLPNTFFFILHSDRSNRSSMKTEFERKEREAFYSFSLHCNKTLLPCQVPSSASASVASVRKV